MDQKRFSLEGGESLVMALDRLFDAVAHDGLDGVVIGMAYRDRLNVLINIAGKPYGRAFDELKGGDVIEGADTGNTEYHLDTVDLFSGADGVSTHVSLTVNPFYPETVDDVVEGIVRAKQDRIDLDGKDYAVMPVLVHGDATSTGQDAVYETLNIGQLPVYHTGGTVHTVANNQIGFTTGSTSAHSATYAIDLTKGLQMPVSHVNADNSETVARIVRHVYEHQRALHKDATIDLICYRRHDHNEGDDPPMVQPSMYRFIDLLDSTRGACTTALARCGDITPQEAQKITKSYQDGLERILAETRVQATGSAGSDDAGETADIAAQDLLGPTEVGVPLSSLEIPYSQRAGTGMILGWTSAVPRDVVECIGDAQVVWSESFIAHPKLQAMPSKHREVTREDGINWGFGESIALENLPTKGVPIRPTGEDTRRATFAQHHAVLHDHTSEQEWAPLSFLAPDQAPLEICDLLPGECAVLVSEYGYSVERPGGLTTWEAQFGDFANGVQSVIGEYVTSAAQKWEQHSGPIMLLPHDQEGQGFDHSSACTEHYLQMCAQDSILVVQPSAPASYFHLLCEHTCTRPRRPLTVLTPKQLLRLKAACSPVEAPTFGTSQPVIGETDDTVLVPVQKQDADRVLLCPGRVYYDLLAHRTETGDISTAIIRLERLYPLESSAITKVLAPSNGVESVWVQDELANQGMQPCLALNLPTDLTGGVPPTLVLRPEAAAPAVGTAGPRRAQREEILRQASVHH